MRCGFSLSNCYSSYKVYVRIIHYHKETGDQCFYKTAVSQCLRFSVDRDFSAAMVGLNSSFLSHARARTHIMYIVINRLHSRETRIVYLNQFGVGLKIGLYKSVSHLTELKALIVCVRT